VIANHEEFTGQMRNCFQTTAIGLGLLRLLQDARRFKEARSTLSCLKNLVQGIETDQQILKPSKGNQLNGGSKYSSIVAVRGSRKTVPSHN
jgi:hypothetical protein